MRQEDVTRAVVIALDAATVLIAFARGVGEVEHLADRAADDVLRELGLVFGPFGLKVTGLGVLTTNREADARPEVCDDGPERLGVGVDAKPALVAVAHELGNDRALHDGAALLSGFACDLSPCHLGVGTDDARTGRHLEAVFIGDRRKIRRHFEIGTRIGGFVLDLVVRKVDAESRAAAKDQQSRTESGGTQRTLIHRGNPLLEKPMRNRASNTGREGPVRNSSAKKRLRRAKTSDRRAADNILKSLANLTASRRF